MEGSDQNEEKEVFRMARRYLDRSFFRNTGLHLGPNRIGRKLAQMLDFFYL